MLEWHKSSFSGEGSACVMMAELPDGGCALKDSKDPGGPVLNFTAAEREAFIRGVVAGEFGTYA